MRKRLPLQWFVCFQLLICVHAQQQQQQQMQLFSFAHTPVEFRADLMQSLPAHWAVCSIAVTDDRSSLLLSRLTRDRAPLLFRLPLISADVCLPGLAVTHTSHTRTHTRIHYTVFAFNDDIFFVIRVSHGLFHYNMHTHLRICTCT